MKVARVFALAIICTLVGPTAALARDMTGFYVTASSGFVGFFNLTEQGGYISGYYQMVQADMNRSEGVARSNFDVSGSETGSQVVLTLHQGLTSYRWTADVGWSGFTVSMPLDSGQIRQTYFHRSSVAEVNQLVANITHSGNVGKYYSNAQAELTDSQVRLSNDIGTYRPQILQNIITAKKKLAQALDKKRKAEDVVESKKQIAAQAHQVADDAKARAVTNDEQYAANDLQYKANSADYDVNSAKYDVQSTQYDVDSATRDLQSVKDDLVKMDARIAQLRGIISRDKAVLHIH